MQGNAANVGVRVGLGYDLHRLGPLMRMTETTRPLVVGGIALGGGIGPIAHSDGDALMHAITDAILGALALPDIGQLFPDKDPQWAGAASEIFLSTALDMAMERGWSVGNVDATVILERPKLWPHKEAIRANLARILHVGADQVNIKGKTHELQNPLDESREIEAHAVVLLVKMRA